MPRPRKFIHGGRPGSLFVPLTAPPNCAADRACATCPFEAGNDKELARLFVEMITDEMPYARLERMLRPFTRLFARLFPKKMAQLARWTARKQVETGLPFICHSSVYKFEPGSPTTMKSPTDWRLCKGAEKVPR